MAVLVALLAVKAALEPVILAGGNHVVVGDPLLPRELPKWLFKVRVLPATGPALDLDSVPVATSPGQVNLQVRLWGLIPLSRLVVNVVPPTRVIPGGHSIGVLLNARGVVVVGFAEVTDNMGQKHSPAREAGIMGGDVIIKVNGRPVQRTQQVKGEIQRCGERGQEVALEVERGDRHEVIRIKPLFCTKTQSYRVGLYVRDSAAGIGTLTFYEPKSRMYGALGHAIMEVGNGQRVELAQGRIVEATIQAIRPSRRGQPGEKIGALNGHGLMGEITRNTPCGIFGPLQEPLSNPLYPQPVPAAMAYQVKKGPAEMLTVLKGNRVERFPVEILQVMPQNKRNGKGMIIKIADAELLKQAGGIVQGMSGSPIIQEGKFVGAVTHVFINDPTKGYGVLAEWMLWDANLMPAREDRVA